MSRLSIPEKNEGKQRPEAAGKIIEVIFMNLEELNVQSAKYDFSSNQPKVTFQF
jgi:hypothetical protein